MTAPETKEKATPGTREVVIVEDDSDFSYLLDTAKFAQLRKIAELFAASDLVPTHYKKLSNCVIALQAAFRMKIDPMMYMQKSYIVHGKPGIEATLAIALLNRSGKIKGAIQYEYKGEGPTRQCTASAIEAETGNRHEMTITWKQVVANGWHLKDQWKNNPDLMLAYRSGMWLTRTRWPEVIFCMLSYEEIVDIEGPINVTPRPTAMEGPEEGEAELRADLLAALSTALEDQKGCDSDMEMALETFIRATAEANGISRVALMEQALDKLDDFWGNFQTWRQNHPQTAQQPAGATKGSDQGDGQGVSRTQAEKGRDEAIDEAIRKVVAEGKVDVERYPDHDAVRAYLPNMKVWQKTIDARWEAIKADLQPQTKTESPEPPAPPPPTGAEANQDTEEPPPAMPPGEEDPAHASLTGGKSRRLPPSEYLTQPEIRSLRSRLATVGIEELALVQELGVDSVEEIKVENVGDIEDAIGRILNREEGGE